MSTEQNKAILQRWMDALNEHDLAQLDRLADELYTNDYILHDPGFPTLLPGPAGVKQFVHAVLSSSSDFHITVEDLVAEEDRVASRIEVRSTDVLTGKPTRTLVMGISRFAGGKIAEEWQLGVPAA